MHALFAQILSMRAFTFFESQLFFCREHHSRLYVFEQGPYLPYP